MTASENKAITAIIIDDEISACKNLQYLLSKSHDLPVEICGIARDTFHGGILIEQYDPEVVFLDIDMPNENGLLFLEKRDMHTFEVVFITAYDEHAVKAFKLNAVDYLLKPINQQELQRALHRVFERIAFKKLSQKHSTSFSYIMRGMNAPNRQNAIVIKDGGILDIVPFNDVLFVEAMGSYARIHFMKGIQQKSATLCYPIADYEQLLPAQMFFRIHKSYLVNCAHISKLVKDAQMYVVLGTNQQLPISRRKAAEFLSFLGQRSYSL